MTRIMTDEMQYNEKQHILLSHLDFSSLLSSLLTSLLDSLSPPALLMTPPDSVWFKSSNGGSTLEILAERGHVQNSEGATNTT